MKLTSRQKNELEYHRQRALEHASLLDEPFSWDVLENPGRRWWNAYWFMYRHLCDLSIAGTRVLVVGCGFGVDALRLAKLGADVYAFDLSPDSLAIAKALAERENLAITFGEVPAESLNYDDDFFDVIVARDILHHVDIPKSMAELVRVARHDAIFVINEIYSHSFTDKIRYSKVVDKVIYSKLQKFIYGTEQPYITEDERKLTEEDMALITNPLHEIKLRTYFNFVVTRVIPDDWELFAKFDRILMIVLKPIARFVAGRIVLSGRISSE